MASPIPSVARFAALGLTVTLLVAGSSCLLRAQTAGDPKPVLVELFTSEGCSDCPPADELLARLDRDQPIAGIHAIVLSEHVTYWNHQGWSDPFSMEQLDYRQKDYQDRFRLQDVYTPQMVIDGTEQFVGSNVDALTRVMAHARSKQSLSIVSSNWEKNAVHFSVQSSAPQGTHLFAAVAQDVTRSEVSRGENAGRTLHHVAVVRTLKEFKSGFVDAPLSLSAPGIKKDAASLRLVVFLADPHNGHVVAAAEKILEKE